HEDVLLRLQLNLLLNFCPINLGDAFPSRSHSGNEAKAFQLLDAFLNFGSGLFFAAAPKHVGDSKGMIHRHLKHRMAMDHKEELKSLVRFAPCWTDLFDSDAID